MAKILNETVANVQLERKGGKVKLHLQVAPEIEEVFKSAVNGVVEEHKNKLFNVEYYPVTSYSSKFNRWANAYYFNMPNKGLDVDKTFNMSFLFVKGVSNGIVLEFQDLTTKEQLEEYGKEMNAVIREIYNEFISDIVVDHEITIKYASV